MEPVQVEVPSMMSAAELHWLCFSLRLSAKHGNQVLWIVGDPILQTEVVEQRCGTAVAELATLAQGSAAWFLP